MPSPQTEGHAFPRFEQDTAVNASRAPSFCIVLPMYNEEANAENCVASLVPVLRGFDCRTGIIAVDDGSTDGTAAALQRLVGDFPELMVTTHQHNKGYGPANRTGLRGARTSGFDYAIVMDADGTQPPESLRKFLAPMRQGVGLIKATRYALGGRVEGVPFSRRLVSLIGNRLARLFLRAGITDYTNGYRAIRTDLADTLQGKERGFEMLIEEVYLARKNGITMAEVPYTLSVRKSPDSASKFTYSWGVYKNYLKFLFMR